MGIGLEWKRLDPWLTKSTTNLCSNGSVQLLIFSCLLTTLLLLKGISKSYYTLNMRLLEEFYKPLYKLLAWSLGREDSLEKGMATYSCILAWRILWSEETGRL